MEQKFFINMNRSSLQKVLVNELKNPYRTDPRPGSEMYAGC